MHHPGCAPTVNLLRPCVEPISGTKGSSCDRAVLQPLLNARTLHSSSFDKLDAVSYRPLRLQS